MQTIVIIDYGSGNLRSAERAVAEAARAMDASVTVTSDPALVRKADRVILPGVGAFGDCIAGLNAVAGMRDALEDAVTKAGKPFLGICVGMQLMAERGLEHGAFPGLGWIAGETSALERPDPALKIPHMGWNAVTPKAASALFPSPRNTPQEFYFVHSYVLKPADPSIIAATTTHGVEFCSAVCKDNLAGVQFHPEKSQRAGLELLTRFLEWRP